MDSGQRTITGWRIGGLPVVQQALAGGDPILRYKARCQLLGEPPGSAELKRLRQAIGSSRIARSLLSGREPDGAIGTHPYRKWQGPHWTLYSLALIDYPPGDSSLLPLRDQVYGWLLDPAHLKYPQSLLLPGQEGRFRRCASQEGNAIWYSIHLGIENEHTRELVERLKRWQWPDGGFALEACNARTSEQVVTRGTRADWGPKGATRTNPLVSIEALRVLKAASPVEAADPAGGKSPWPG